MSMWIQFYAKRAYIYIRACSSIVQTLLARIPLASADMRALHGAFARAFPHLLVQELTVVPKHQSSHATVLFYVVVAYKRSARLVMKE